MQILRRTRGRRHRECPTFCRCEYGKFRQKGAVCTTLGQRGYTGGGWSRYYAQPQRWFSTIFAHRSLKTIAVNCLGVVHLPGVLWVGPTQNTPQTLSAAFGDGLNCLGHVSCYSGAGTVPELFRIRFGTVPQTSAFLNGSWKVLERFLNGFQSKLTKKESNHVNCKPWCGHPLPTPSWTPRGNP